MISVLIGLLVALAVCSLAVSAVKQAGANPVLVAVERYGALLFAPIVALALLGASIVVLRGVTRVAVLAAFVADAALWASSSRSLRRVVIRCQWPSIARSCGLAVTRDRRPGSLLGATTTIGSESVEHLPAISWGRSLPGDIGCRWRLRPARGSEIAEVAKAAEAIAAALRVHSVTVHRITAARGTLTVLWGDTLPVQSPVVRS